MELVSIIIPVYNAAGYLHECIDGVLSQSYSNIEVVLVDDGSTDRSGDICDEYANKDKRVHVVKQQNSGQSHARNAGIQIANGKFLFFVDSDDLLHRDYCKRLVETISDSDLGMCGYQRVLSKDDILTNYEANGTVTELNENDLWEEVVCRLNNAAWNKIYRRDIIGNQRFPSELAHGEDMMFNLQYLSKCSKGRKTTAKLYYYRATPGSVTNSSFSQRRLNEIYSKDQIAEYIRTVHPNLLPVAECYRFKARLNIVRAIYKNRTVAEYKPTIDKCLIEMRDILGLIKKNLTAKDRVEYFLQKRAVKLYALIAARL